MTDIHMPSLSDAMVEGTVLTWLKADGDQVDEGDELVEIETDKATMTYESPVSGVLEIVAESETTVSVGTVIARMTSSPAEDGTGNGAAHRNPAEAPSGHAGEPGAISAATAAATARRMIEDRPAARATPLARRLASAHEIDLSDLAGTGPRGRVRRVDVERAAGLEPAGPLRPHPAARAQTPAPPSAHAAPASPDVSAEDRGTKGQVDVIEPTRLQQVIARRMSEAKATIPEFQVEAEVALDAAIALRTRFKEQAGDRAPSFNDLIIKACALALRDHPRANGSYRDDVFELHGRINIGMAVATEDALVVPTVFDADTLSLGSIAAETKRLAGRVREGEITPPELSGATFTVSNLGMYGMSAITPVINPPQAAILGVGSTRALPALVDGELSEHHVLTLRLSCDHRILYGADAAQFLAAVRGYLEQPLRLAL